MYSQCPACLARFRVTAERLRAAHGRARCGRCGQAFDMLDRLSDELPAASTAVAASGTLEADTPPVIDALAKADTEFTDAARAELAVGAEHGGEDYHFSAEDVEKVFIDARDWQRQYGTRVGAASGGASDFAVADPSQLVVDEPQGIEDITLEGLKVEIASDTGESTHLEAEFDYVEDEYAREDAVEPQSDTDLEQEDENADLDSTSRLRTLDQVPDLAYPVDSAEARPATDDERRFYQALIEGRDLPVAEPAAAVARGTVAAAPALAEMRSEPRIPPAGRWADARRSRSGDDELPDFDLATDQGATRPPSPWLALGSVFLALTLAAQLTHHFRQDIARHPQAGPALRRLYQLSGQPLSPNWDLDAFEINQWGPTQDVAPGSALVVRAGLTNRADHAQPYPLLRLEFEDRFGAAVARRDFTPGEYLKSSAQAARQLAAGETTEAELSVVAPGADAVGYRLDVCLREDAGGVRCAHAE